MVYYLGLVGIDIVLLNIVRLRGVSKVGDEGSGSIEEQMEEWLSIEKLIWSYFQFFEYVSTASFKYFFIARI